MFGDMMKNMQSQRYGTLMKIRVSHQLLEPILSITTKELHPKLNHKAGDKVVMQ